jgi:hypothetical protein
MRGTHVTEQLDGKLGISLGLFPKEIELLLLVAGRRRQSVSGYSWTEEAKARRRHDDSLKRSSGSDLKAHKGLEIL